MERTEATERIPGATESKVEAMEGIIRATERIAEVMDTPPSASHIKMRNLYQTNKRKNKQSISRDKMK
ncbi:hypothetical protein ACFVT8_20895 [Lysinibacillus sp. NPDC058147]|uniref:hypothetical protein n=1 Tax=unclassified Lysinibacillus TaxID=2636778 RepID=UPI0036DD1251